MDMKRLAELAKLQRAAEDEPIIGETKPAPPLNPRPPCISSPLMMRFSCRWKMTRNQKNSRTMLVADECWTMIDPRCPQSLKETTALFDLNDVQSELITSGQRGTALMKAGNRAVKVRFILSDERLEMFGKGGGR